MFGPVVEQIDIFEAGIVKMYGTLMEIHTSDKKQILLLKLRKNSTHLKVISEASLLIARGNSCFI